ncbi:MAG: hypothetical protein Q8T04_13130 [Bacteroidota bacterium]|nr:hypothetical protein [Bacteroidota bacterium]
MPNKKNTWVKENPSVQELFKQVKVKLNCSEDERLTPDNILALSKKTYINKRTLNEYFGLTKPRSCYCRISNLNELAKFIGKKDFETFFLGEKEKQERISIVPQSLKTAMDEPELSSNITAGKAPFRKVVKKLINSADLKNDIYQILISIYPKLQKNTNPESEIDFFMYDAEEKNIEFAFTVLNFSYTPFDKHQLDRCQKVIEKIKKLPKPVFSFVLICNTLTNTSEYKTMLNETAELQNTGKAEISRFYDIRSFLINEVAENIDIEIRDRILESNQKFKDQFQKQMDQYFYVEDVPFTIDLDSKKHSNPVGYLAESSIRQKNKFSELEYSIGKQLASGSDSPKGWNFVISEFGFGKTSLLLNLYKKLNQSNILSIFLPLSFFRERSLYTTSDISRIVLEILFDERKFDYKRNFDRLMAGTLDNMLERRCDLILLFDGLDEHQAAYTPQGLQDIFRGTAKLSAECFFTMRKEFWDDRQGNFRMALEPIKKKHKFYSLSEWSDSEILKYIDEYVKKREIEKEEAERVNEFRELVMRNSYDQFYGDIPRRPLFLKMLMVDIKNNQIKKRNLSEIYEQYLVEKFSIDRRSQFSNKIRTPLKMEKTEDRDKVLGRIFYILEKAAALMFAITKEKECILISSVEEDKIEEIKFLKEKEFVVTEILMNSILVPLGKRNHEGFYLKFAHKSFQEYFFARAIYTTLIEPNSSDKLSHIMKSKHSDGVVTFMKGIIDSKRGKIAEFYSCLRAVSEMNDENLTPTSLLSLLTGYFSGDIQNLISG